MLLGLILLLKVDNYFSLIVEFQLNCWGNSTIKLKLDKHQQMATCHWHLQLVTHMQNKTCYGWMHIKSDNSLITQQSMLECLGFASTILSMDCRVTRPLSLTSCRDKSQRWPHNQLKQWNCWMTIYYNMAISQMSQLILNPSVLSHIQVRP